MGKEFPASSEHESSVAATKTIKDPKRDEVVEDTEISEVVLRKRGDQAQTSVPNLPSPTSNSSSIHMSLNINPTMDQDKNNKVMKK